MTLIGLVRVTGARYFERHHDALDPICTRVLEETASRRLLTKNRPELLAALDYPGPDDVLVVMKANHLAQIMVDGLHLLNELFERGVVVKVLEGSAAGVHTERSPILHADQEVAELRYRILRRRVKADSEAARARRAVGGRHRVIDDNKRAVILSRSEEEEPLRSIAQSLGVSVGTV